MTKAAVHGTSTVLLQCVESNSTTYLFDPLEMLAKKLSALSERDVKFAREWIVTDHRISRRGV